MSDDHIIVLAIVDTNILTHKDNHFRSRDLADKVETLEEKAEKLEDIIEDKNVEISTYQGETNRTKAEMTVINKVRRY